MLGGPGVEGLGEAPVGEEGTVAPRRLPGLAALPHVPPALAHHEDLPEAKHYIPQAGAQASVPSGAVRHASATWTPAPTDLYPTRSVTIASPCPTPMQRLTTA